MADAKGDVFRGYEVVEHSTSFGSLAQGESLENVARGVDIYSYRVPLGVCGGICPFNFPAMIPLWMYPLAITLGNTYVMKPSEKVAGTAQIPGLVFTYTMTSLLQFLHPMKETNGFT